MANHRQRREKRCALGIAHPIAEYSERAAKGAQEEAAICELRARSREERLPACANNLKFLLKLLVSLQPLARSFNRVNRADRWALQSTASVASIRRCSEALQPPCANASLGNRAQGELAALQRDTAARTNAAIRCYAPRWPL